MEEQTDLSFVEESLVINTEAGQWFAVQVSEPPAGGKATTMLNNERMPVTKRMIFKQFFKK